MPRAAALAVVALWAGAAWADEAAAATDDEALLIQLSSKGKIKPSSNTGRTKYVAGVAVLNYHLVGEAEKRAEREEKNAEGAAHSGKPKRWIVNFPVDFSDSQQHTFCDHLPENAECLDEGHPSEDGVAFVNLFASEFDLEQILKSKQSLLGVAPGANNASQVTASLIGQPGKNTTFVEPDLAVANAEELFNEPIGGQALIELLGSHDQGPSSWGLDRIDDRDGLDQTYEGTGGIGHGVHVYIADTGIRTSHRDFQGRAVADVETFENKVRECMGQKNCALDDNGHGTHMAGTVGGRSFGVAKGVTLHAVKALNSTGQGTVLGL